MNVDCIVRPPGYTARKGPRKPEHYHDNVNDTAFLGTPRPARRSGDRDCRRARAARGRRGCRQGTGNVGRYDDAIRLAERHDLGLPTSETTIIRLLKRAGYTAVGFGKWHLGYEPKFGPLEHGFDYYFGLLGGGVDYYYHCEWDGVHMLYENQRPVRREGYLTDLITHGAVEFVRGYKGPKPFFLYLPYTAPHTPLEGPDDKPPAARTQEDWNEGTRETYVAMVERLDWGIGKVLQALDDRGLADHTLVVFFSDNGGTKTGRNAPFSGYKGGLFEGGIREPCIVRWPAVLPEGIVTDQTAIALDLSKSIVRAAAAELPEDRPFEGIDILKHVEEHRPPVPRTLFWRQRRGESTWRAVRDGSLKYLTRRDGDRFDEYLFDLDADPGEKHNLHARPGRASRRFWPDAAFGVGRHGQDGRTLAERCTRVVAEEGGPPAALDLGQVGLGWS